nr:MAG TPA: hypothetical protein [Caudoviricetes sp.]
MEWLSAIGVFADSILPFRQHRRKGRVQGSNFQNQPKIAAKKREIVEKKPNKRK